MHTFKDKNGTEWNVAVNVTTVKRVRESLSIDLLDREAVWKDIARDPVALVNTLFVLCETEAKSRGITDEDFGAAMGGDAIENATDALLEEIVDFSPSRERARGKKALAKIRDWDNRMQTKMDELQEGPEVAAKLESLMTELESEMKTRIGSVGNSPELSASSPGG